MALDSVIKGTTSGNGAEVDDDNNLKVNLPVNPILAGVVRSVFSRDAANAFENRVTEEGELMGSASRLLYFADFNGSTRLNNQFNVVATTQTAHLTGGFLRLNAGNVTTANTGVAAYSSRTFTIEEGQALRVKAKIRHTNGATANKQFDFGLGMYAIAAYQAGAMIEFAGFRWTQGGQLLGVLEYSLGGAATSVTVNLNGGVPFSDDVTHEYEVVLTTNRIEFWVNRTYLGEILRPNDGAGILKSNAYPVIFRHFISTATAVAPTFYIAQVGVMKSGSEADIPVQYRQALMGRHSAYPQSGIAGANGNTATNVVTATAPTATTGSNTATALTGLGGYYALNLASFTAANANVIVDSFQNPGFPTAQGAATDTRNLVLTDILISPGVITTTATGGGAVVEWFLAFGNTTTSHAAIDSDGSTTLASKAPRYIPLPVVDSYEAAVAAGTVVPRSGDGKIQLNTPIVIHPGECVSLGYRVIRLGAVFTAGVVSGGIGFSGYWD